MDKHQRPYKCTKTNCNAKEFGNMGDLRRHQRTVHGPRAFICIMPSCKRRGKAFGRKDDLSEHLKRVHGMEQPLALGASARQGGAGFEVGNHNSEGEFDEQSIGGEDGSGEDDVDEGSASPMDKASLTAKLKEMERDVAALKRVLAFM
jgi:hypothetical protein